MLSTYHRLRVQLWRSFVENFSIWQIGSEKVDLLCGSSLKADSPRSLWLWGERERERDKERERKRRGAAGMGDKNQFNVPTVGVIPVTWS